MKIKHESCNPKFLAILNLSLLTENTEQALYLLHVLNVRDKIGIDWLKINKTIVQRKYFILGI